MANLGQLGALGELEQELHLVQEPSQQKRFALYLGAVQAVPCVLVS